MKTKEEIKQWLLKNCVNEYGFLDLGGLDFSDFDGDVNLSKMVVKRSLVQNHQKVSEYLVQDLQEVGETLYQDCQKVGDSLFQSLQKVEGNLYQDKQKVKKDLVQWFQKVGGTIYQDNVINKEKEDDK